VGDVVLGSVYVPNGGKDLPAKMTFLRELVAWAGRLQDDHQHLVLCGDFNVARTDRDVHPMLRKPMIGQSTEERALIEALFGYGLVDVARRVDPDNDRLFTWWAPWRNQRQRNIGWRLDYVAAAEALVDETVHCATYRDVGTSDHAPVIAHLRDTPRAAAAVPSDGSGPVT
jgi:exodeoxyribonuclease-3